MGGCFETSRPTAFPEPDLRGGRHPALLRAEPPVGGRALLDPGPHQRPAALPARRRPAAASSARSAARPDLRRGTYLYRGRCARESLAARVRPARSSRRPRRGPAMNWAETYRSRVTTAARGREGRSAPATTSGSTPGAATPRSWCGRWWRARPSCEGVEVVAPHDLRLRRLRATRATRGRSATARSSPAPTSAQAVERGPRRLRARRTSPRSRASSTPARCPVDVALIHVSPPDEHGFCSFGVGVECTKAAAEQAPHGHRARQPPHAALARRLLHPRLAPRPRRGGGPAGAGAAAGAGRVGDGRARHRRPRRGADRGRRDAADGHRRDPGRRAPQPRRASATSASTPRCSRTAWSTLFESGVITGAAKTLHRGQDHRLLRARARGRPSTSSTTTPSSSSTPPTT